MFKVVLTFVVARKGQWEREFLFGPLVPARGQAAAWLTGCVRRVNQLHGLHLPLEFYALKRGAASCLDDLQLAPHKINMHVGWSPGSNSLLHCKWAVTVEAIDR